MNFVTIMPKVSVIVPVYNAERYLRRCIDSILSQTFTDFELILIDDGSSDLSWKICDEYARRYSNVVVFHTENRGASLARKTGIAKAKGEYVAFVDSDDFVRADYLEILYNLIIKYNTRIGACGVYRIKNERDIPSALEVESDCVLVFDTLMKRFFKYEFWGFWGKMYAKQLFDYVTFPRETVSEDYYVMAQIFLKEKTMPVTDAQLYYYEYHDNSLSHLKISPRSFEEFINVRNTYRLAKQNCPQYKSLALGNVVETCIKLLAQSKHDKVRFVAERNDMISFLKQNFSTILFAKNIYWKYKVLTAKILLGV